MATKKAAPTNEELLAQFDELDEVPKDDKARKAPSIAKGRPSSSQEAEADPMADLSNLVQDRPKSRPETPRVVAGSRASTSTPPVGTRSSEDRPMQSRKSGESTRSFHQSFTPADTHDEPSENKESEMAAQAGGGWWGGIMATASAAVRQAEALAKEIQKNEEAQRWAEQVKGNVGALRSYGGELRSRALPTFTNILHTLAPPISAHERLQIHATHDFVGYPSLDPLIHQTFSRIMAQVEGGELLVLQRGNESSPRREGYSGGSTAGWSDGPWWRQTDRRDLGSVQGLVEATKLCRASAEGYASEYFASRGGVEGAAKRAAEILSESNPTRCSDIFLAIQAVAHHEENTLFTGAQRPENENEEGGITEPAEEPDELLGFAVYLHDPIHGLTFHTLSQSLPLRWAKWLDRDPQAVDAAMSSDTDAAALPADIQEIVQGGGVDPREWVSEWVEETLVLSIGVVAQRYVARRMGVGEGGLARGKGRAEVIEAGAGEAARAM